MIRPPPRVTQTAGDGRLHNQRGAVPKINENHISSSLAAYGRRVTGVRKEAGLVRAPSPPAPVGGYVFPVYSPVSPATRAMEL